MSYNILASHSFILSFHAFLNSSDLLNFCPQGQKQTFSSLLVHYSCFYPFKLYNMYIVQYTSIDNFFKQYEYIFKNCILDCEIHLRAFVVVFYQACVSLIQACTQGRTQDFRRGGLKSPEILPHSYLSLKRQFRVGLASTHN